MALAYSMVSQIRLWTLLFIRMHQDCGVMALALASVAVAIRMAPNLNNVRGNSTYRTQLCYVGITISWLCIVI